MVGIIIVLYRWILYRVLFFKSGGVVEWVPCSHVAHIYRGPRTESIHPAGGNPFQSSIVRLFSI
jgi:hypothetical protein